MRSLIELLEKEIAKKRDKLIAYLYNMKREENLPADCDLICETLDGLPGLLQILADITVKDSFSQTEVNQANYALYYLISDDDIIPDTTDLEIGYLDDLLVVILILNQIHQNGDQTRFTNYTIKGKPFGEFLEKSMQQHDCFVPKVITERIKKLLAPILDS